MVNVIQDPLLYKDDYHLNEKGAELFTSLFVERLRNND